MATIFECWQAPDRDSVTIDFAVTGIFGNPLLALLNMEGERGTIDEEVEKVTGIRINRARRWHKILERMGVVYLSEDGITHLTDLGKILRDLPSTASDTRIFRRKVARAAVSVLRKYQLKNPSDESPQQYYPHDCDIHPYWAIWKAADELDGKIHWDELNRELMRVLRHDDLPGAIDRIRKARQQPDYDPIAGGSAAVPLSERCYVQDTAPLGKDPDGQVRDQKTTPWFRRAGFGGLLLESPRQVGRGYWHIPDDIRDIIHETTVEIPSFQSFDSEDDWFAYFGSIDAEVNIDIAEESGEDTGTIKTSSIEVDWSLAESNTGMLRGLVGLDRAFRRAMSALRSGKHLILIGPPGTGKTELATRICGILQIQCDVVTATSDWTTFDTIGGYLPDPRLRGERDEEPLNFFPGVVLRSLERGRWLIMDEINRADIDKAFGELFTVLSGRSVRLPFKKRDGDQLHDIVLGDTEEQDVYAFPIPQDWRIIGTMNTFDKASLFQLSYAFMRRFAFVDVPVPNSEDFKRIISSTHESLEAAFSDDTFITECLTYLEGLFATEETEGLGKVGLRIGPAIPLDMIRFIRERYASSVREGVTESPRNLVLEGIEMYLYPQFEGKDREHEGIVDAVSQALGLDEASRANTSRLLSNWTGYEAPAGTVD